MVVVMLIDSYSNSGGDGDVARGGGTSGGYGAYCIRQLRPTNPLSGHLAAPAKPCERLTIHPFLYLAHPCAQAATSSTPALGPPTSVGSS